MIIVCKTSQAAAVFKIQAAWHNEVATDFHSKIGHLMMQDWPLDATRLHALAAELFFSQLYVAHGSWLVTSSSGCWTCKRKEKKRTIICPLMAVSKPPPLLHDLLQLWPQKGYKMKTQKYREGGWTIVFSTETPSSLGSYIKRPRNSVVFETLSFYISIR